MKKMGNVNSNRMYNPQNAKPSIPIDVDEVDGAMERFIRQKYETAVFSGGASRPETRHNTGSTSSVEDQPPPLPPKPGKRFGFSLRSASSTFPMTRKNARAEMDSPPATAGLSGFEESEPQARTNKPSRIFGTSIDRTSGDSFEQKLANLREMGFTDERRNSTVLKGHNGNLDKAVESLIRIEGASKPASRSETPGGAINGISVEKTRQTPSASNHSNPFERLDQQQQQQQPAPVQQLQQSQVNGNSYSQPASPNNPYNPFNMHQQQATQGQSFEQSLQNMSISSQQQLFPNNTGGFAAPGFQQQTNPFLKTFTPPPIPQIPPQYDQTPSQQYPQQQQNAQATSHTQASNPFLRTSRSQIFSPSNPFGQPSATQAPFTQSQQFAYQPQNNQQMPQQQPQSYQQPPQQYPQMQISSQPSPFSQQAPQQASPLHNPYFTQPPSQPPQPYAQAQSLLSQPTGTVRHDKQSILALYNYPQPGVSRPATIAEHEPLPSHAAAWQAPSGGSATPMPMSMPPTNGDMHVGMGMGMGPGFSNTGASGVKRA
ncbi:MAG: hypothetical protein Q9157_001083, partial [Trypethelium eluteriae]